MSDKSPPPIPVPGGFYLVALKNKRQPGAFHEVIHLKQILSTSDTPEQKEHNKNALIQFKTGYQGCQSLQEDTIPVKNITINDLGQVNLESLSEDVKKTISSLQIGDISDPEDTDFGIQMLAVCDKKHHNENMPDRVQIEDRLLSLKLNNISRRYLRDLRRDATIESRLQ